MKRLSIFTLILGLTAFAAAADTTAILGGGICINEILVDPNGTVNNFDTDGNGVNDDQEDEFIELYNLSGSSIDISGWELWDSAPAGFPAGSPWFTFPASTIVPADGYVYVLYNLQAGGSLGANGFNAAGSSATNGVFANGAGDNVVLRNPIANEYVHIKFHNIAATDPNTWTGFPPAQTRVGPIEDFLTTRHDGESYVRVPDGGDTVARHSQVALGGTLATPGSALIVIPEDPNIQMPSSLNFGFVPVSDTKTLTFNITNSPASTANLNISAINGVSGQIAGYTILTAMPINGLIPGAVTTISVQVSTPPTDNPTFDAVFEVVSNDPGAVPNQISFTTNAASFTAVNDVATARIVPDTAGIRITGAVTLSTDPNAFGGATIGGVPHRIYPVQDATGGILLLEPESALVFGPALDAGSVITGVAGEKERFAAGSGGTFLEEIFVYDYITQVDGGAELTPQSVTLAQFATDPTGDTFESELVQITGVSTSSTGNWAAGTNYEFTDGTSLIIDFRLESARSALVGTPLPVGSVSLVGIGDNFGVADPDPDATFAPMHPADLMAGAPAKNWNLFE